MPVPKETAERLIAANQRFLEQCRGKSVPVIHLVTSYRDKGEIRANPFWRIRADDPAATRKNVEAHNLAGSPGCEIIPSLLDAGRDRIVDSKKRYDCFLGTDLNFLLRSLGVNTLLITGVNTNSCVLATVAAANVHDYAVIAVEDCIGTMDGAALHEAGLRCIRTAFGWVMTGAQAIEDVLGGARLQTE